MANITTEEDWLASLDRPDDCGFEFITRGVDVCKAFRIRMYTRGSGALTKNRTATPDVPKLVDSIELVVGVSRIVDEREGFHRLNDRGKPHISQRQEKATNRVFRSKRLIEFDRCTFPLAIFPILVVIFPGK